MSTAEQHARLRQLPHGLAGAPPLYATEDVPLVDKIIHAHAFLGACDWWIAEFDGDDTLFGYADLGDPDNAEWGYVSLVELSQIRGQVAVQVLAARGPWSQYQPKIVNGRPVRFQTVSVEWDQHWTPKPFGGIER